METTGYPFDDTQDFDDPARGFIARATTRQVTAADGRVVWEPQARMGGVSGAGTANHRATSAPAPGSTTLTLGRRTLIGPSVTWVRQVAATTLRPPFE